ncbi:conserved hypothetical protein [Microcystis aeruginosa PCC 9807]|uniref:Uncharacterized protein n=2 Tax=Microcystis aeruginosa TaxID=1126 RepID=I4H8R6_MICAE|nr:conserved hypothetical protein [Microcystis aeruginosa PCC 9807]
MTDLVRCVNINVTHQPTLNKGLTVMSSIITEEKTKEILTEILIEMMQNKRELFYEIVIEALEDIGLANAITEGLNGEFVPEEEVFAILNGEVE